MRKSSSGQRRIAAQLENVFDLGQLPHHLRDGRSPIQRPDSAPAGDRRQNVAPGTRRLEPAGRMRSCGSPAVGMARRLAWPLTRAAEPPLLMTSGAAGRLSLAAQPRHQGQERFEQLAGRQPQAHHQRHQPPRQHQHPGANGANARDERLPQPLANAPAARAGLNDGLDVAAGVKTRAMTCSVSRATSNASRYPTTCSTEGLGTRSKLRKSSHPPTASKRQRHSIHAPSKRSTQKVKPGLGEAALIE